MVVLDTSQIKEVGRALRENSAGLLVWQWDDRFQTALSSFITIDSKQVEDLLMPTFAFVWDAKSIRQASPIVQQIAADVGLHPGQRLYTTDPNSSLVLFGAWWPWGNGETISLRMGVSASSLSASDAAALQAELKGSFGL